jgi:hypothetical protein
MRLRTAATACCFALLVSGVLAQAASAEGSFETNDALVNLIWRNSVKTARDMISPAVDLDRRGCDIDSPVLLLDGAQRDRCPYIGDQAVTGKTLLVSTDDVSVLREMLLWFSSAQNADGSIPASPFKNRSLVLIDYNAYWIECLYDYVLYTGDVGFLRQVWPTLIDLVDAFYPAHVNNGVLVNWLGAADYAYIPRGGNRVAYYNAQYIRALKLAAALAGWYGDAQRAERWQARASESTVAFGSAFWDPDAGAFRDTTADTDVHPLDGNAFAILSGAASPSQVQSVLTYVDRTMRRGYGNSVADTDAWRGANWGAGDHQRVYPFISFFEVLARYSVGADASALELIKREWGFMARRSPGTMWETIANQLGAQVDATPSFDHGWSSGAAPALTSFVLGVHPTSPGFETFTVTPHTAGLTSARGVVPTPHGPIRVEWTVAAGQLAVQVTAPPGTEWENAPQPQVTQLEATKPAAAAGRPSVKGLSAVSSRATTLPLAQTLLRGLRTVAGW